MNLFSVQIFQGTKNLLIDNILSIIERNEKVTINFLNINKVVMIKNKKFRDIFSFSNIIAIDGTPIYFLTKIFRQKNFYKISGSDLFFDLLEIANKNKQKIFLIGATSLNLKKTCEYISKNYPELIIAGAFDGFYQNDKELELLNIINNTKPNYLFLGIPSPEKEIFSFKYKDSLNVNIIMSVGGVFDITAGVIKRAPLWMQKSGLEWIFRIVQEPKRLFVRYFVNFLQFLPILIKEVYFQFIRNKA